jgi:putative FmdB family regulatory protein
MPLYTYHCDGCGTKVDEFRSVNERDEVGVHICKKERSGYLVRQFATPHLGAIPGIPNRLNIGLNEGGDPIDHKLAKYGLA